DGGVARKDRARGGRIDLPCGCARIERTIALDDVLSRHLLLDRFRIDPHDRARGTVEILEVETDMAPIIENRIILTAEIAQDHGHSRSGLRDDIPCPIDERDLILIVSEDETLLSGRARR